ncbi:MAG: MEKHLA domain-containing protein [Synechococcaceae cyanobacterium]|nr:MEKHLA domain-containing protein [Synechococcaceae cyanobacterium]
MPEAALPEPASAADPGWLTPRSLEVAACILRSHQLAFGRPLLPVRASSLDRRQRAQELFQAPLVLLAHDGGEDPRLVWANREALRLWRRRWDTMVGLPSRLTAEPQWRRERAEALQRARRLEAIEGYAGVRVDSDGRRFRIEGARLWTLRDPAAAPCGQAAAFGRWWWLD